MITKLVHWTHRSQIEILVKKSEKGHYSVVIRYGESRVKWRKRSEQQADQLFAELRSMVYTGAVFVGLRSDAFSPYQWDRLVWSAPLPSWSDISARGCYFLASACRNSEGLTPAPFELPREYRSAMLRTPFLILEAGHGLG